MKYVWRQCEHGMRATDWIQSHTHARSSSVYSSIDRLTHPFQILSYMYTTFFFSSIKYKNNVITLNWNFKISRMLKCSKWWIFLIMPLALKEREMWRSQNSRGIKFENVENVVDCWKSLCAIELNWVQLLNFSAFRKPVVWFHSRYELIIVGSSYSHGFPAKVGVSLCRAFK